mmetsp:Transcript_18652/g.40617  ORF Transcript_18652/g.40617 Transcript_18652/m.40617 type:complete len:292 (+) Transcript_18652:733-1608(+)
MSFRMVDIDERFLWIEIVDPDNNKLFSSLRFKRVWVVPICLLFIPSQIIVVRGIETHVWPIHLIVTESHVSDLVVVHTNFPRVIHSHVVSNLMKLKGWACAPRAGVIGIVPIEKRQRMETFHFFRQTKHNKIELCCEISQFGFCGFAGIPHEFPARGDPLVLVGVLLEFVRSVSRQFNGHNPTMYLYVTLSPSLEWHDLQFVVAACLVLFLEGDRIFENVFSDVVRRDAGPSSRAVEVHSIGHSEPHNECLLFADGGNNCGRCQATTIFIVFSIPWCLQFCLQKVDIQCVG